VFSEPVSSEETYDPEDDLLLKLIQDSMSENEDLRLSALKSRKMPDSSKITITTPKSSNFHVFSLTFCLFHEFTAGKKRKIFNDDDISLGFISLMYSLWYVQ